MKPNSSYAYALLFNETGGDTSLHFNETGVDTPFFQNICKTLT